MASSPWSGRLLVQPGGIAYAGPIAPTSPHQHHALQLVLAPGGIDIAGPDGQPERFTTALIPADTEHTICSAVAEGRIVLLDPESSFYQRLVSRLGGPSTALGGPPAALGALEDLGADAAAALVARPLSAGWIEALLACVGATTPAPPLLHPGVRRVLKVLAERLEGGELDLASLAAVANLSEGRLAHVFREQVGLPLRPYVLWLRVQRAARTLAQGCTITEAAHEAGFADASHLSRTFRRMFGLAPSDLAGWVEWLTPDEGAPVTR